MPQGIGSKLLDLVSTPKKPKYTLDLQKPDGTIKTVPWDKEEDPTPDEMNDLLKLPDPSGPGFFSGLRETLVDPLINTGKTAAEHIRQRNYPAAFGDIVSPIMHPFEGIEQTLMGKPPEKPGTELAGQVGIPVDSLKDAYSKGQYMRMAGQLAPTILGTAFSARGMMKGRTGPTIEAAAEIPRAYPRLIANTPEVIKPTIESPTAFEGLTSGPEAPTFNWDAEHQQGLPLEWNDAQLQEPLKQEPRSAGMTGDKPEIHAFDALVPDRYKSAAPEYPSVTGPRQPELFPNPSPEVPVILQPKQFDFERPTWSRYAEQQSLPLHYDTLSEAELSDIPEVQKAAQQVVEQEAAKPKDTTFSRKDGYVKTDPQSIWSRASDDLIKRNSMVLNHDSPAGRGIAAMIEAHKAESATSAGKISAKIKEVVLPLNTKQYRQFQELLDTGADIPAEPKLTIDNANVGRQPKVNPDVLNHPGLTNRDMINNTNPTPEIQATDRLPPEFSNMQQPTAMDRSVDPQVRTALDTVRQLDKDFTQRIINSGIHLKDASGNLVPFMGKENYWPRIYDSAMFADKPALIQRLIEQEGMAPDVAANVAKNSRYFGERLISPQNARVMNMPGYRTDVGALIKHYYDMTDRVTAAEIFGVKDIADPDTPLSQLVTQTKDPARVTNMLRQYLHRDNTAVAPHENAVMDKISKAMTVLSLSKFAITNTSNLALLPALTNFASTGKAIGQFLKGPKNAWSEAEGLGALKNVVRQSVMDPRGDSIISNVYGIKPSIGTNRTIAALAAKNYIQDVFADFKKNPFNAKARKTLEDMTLTSGDDLSNQPSLTDKQIAYAATRVSDNLHGNLSTMDLPYKWNGSPYIKLLTMFKSYAFNQGAKIKDALKNDPTRPFIDKQGVNINARNAAIMAPLFLAAGEASGDTREGIKSLFTGNFDKRLEARGQYLPFNPIVNRVVQDYIDSTFLGLLADVAKSARGGAAGVTKFLVGAPIGFAVDTGADVVSDTHNLLTKNPASAQSIRKNPNKSKVLNTATQHIPFIGDAIRESMK